MPRAPYTMKYAEDLTALAQSACPVMGRASVWCSGRLAASNGKREQAWMAIHTSPSESRKAFGHPQDFSSEFSFTTWTQQVTWLPTRLFK
eukprot:1157824-Pelagomonas_calceolata.AAC.7